jgi:uncharacterized protein (DUF1800 family)
MQPLTRRDFLKLGSLTAASAALAACQPAATQTATPTAGPTATALPPATPVVPVEAQDLPGLEFIVLNRLAFGPRPGDIEAFRALGADDDQRLAAWVDAQIHPDSIDDSAFEARLAAAKFETLGKSLEQLTEEHIVNNPYDDNDDRHWQWYVLPVDELVEVTLLRAVFSRRQLQELLADFWHNHFNVYGWQDDVTPLFVSYDRDVVRAHLFGNFRQMLEAVASHPSMLFYLNNRTNSDAGPNENFARELFELHTLGAENYLGVRDPQGVPLNDLGLATGYVDNDVYEAARCFTGWRVDDDLWDGEEDVGKTGRFLYYREWHDRFNKFVLGRYLPADQPDMKDGRDVLDMLAAHPGTATFISRRLCRRFVGDNPPESLVQAAAQTFLDARSAPDQLRQVYRTILLSPEFRQTWGGKIKRPFEQVAGVLRALEADFTRLPGGVRWTWELMGQPLFGRHTPDGYPDRAEAWANTMATLYSWNFTIGVAENWFNDEKEPARAIHVDLAGKVSAANNSAAALADAWIERLLGRPLPDESRSAIVTFLAGGYGPDDELPDDHINWRLPGTVELILMTPEFRMR